MKKTLLILLLASIFSHSFAQTCAFDSLKAKLQQKDSFFNLKHHKQMIANVQASKNYPLGSIQEFYSKRVVAPNMAHYVIPIVVHVVHDGSAIGTGCNISDAQISHQIDSLNHAFKPYNIQFCLAKKKPDSSSFNGITRQQNTLTNYRMGLDNDALMAINAFPRNQYLNIWIVKSILNDDGSPSNFAGSAAYPGAEKLGVTIRADFFGNVATCGSCNLHSNSRGKALVHEI